MTKILTRDDILAAKDVQRKQVEVKEWGGHVGLRALSSDALEQFQNFVASRPKKGIAAKLLSLSICDDDGSLVFSDSDLEQLGRRSAAVTTRLYKAALEMTMPAGDPLNAETTTPITGVVLSPLPSSDDGIPA